LAIDNAIFTILGRQVLKAIYDSLKEHHDISGEEIPYRLDTVFKMLEGTFGYQGAITLGRVIAKRVYARMGLQFRELPDYELQDYLDQAKKQLTLLP
jgi:hypothetical protein